MKGWRRNFRIMLKSLYKEDYFYLESYLEDFIDEEIKKAREEGRREALEQIRRVIEDEMLVITRDGTSVLEEYIGEWLSKLKLGESKNGEE